MKKLSDIIVRAAYAGLASQRGDGSMQPGHNGPHQDPERPSRNTGHWLMTWCRAWQLTGDLRLRLAANRAADYLLQPEQRPGGFTVHHRDSVGKDRCNGVMGPAFSIEAAVTGGVTLVREDLLEFASQLIRQHAFSEKQKMWFTREITGEQLEPDPTLNHQIWLASAIARANAAGVHDGANELAEFIGSLPNLMALRKSGRVRHLALTGSLFRDTANLVSERIRGVSVIAERREIAYHTYNVFPLAIVLLHHPEARPKLSRKLNCVLGYMRGHEYQRVVASPAMIDPFIPAGFPLSFAERALIDQVLEGDDEGRQAELITQQLALNYNWMTGLLTERTIDPLTQAARFYEVTLLKDVLLATEDAMKLETST